jgi:hypothetical protein
MINPQVNTDVTYDVIEVEGNLYPAMQWCKKTFGDPGQRWFMSNDSFYFLKARDATLFELRWCQ